jgi:hypothetical protein
VQSDPCSCQLLNCTIKVNVVLTACHALFSTVERGLGACLINLFGTLSTVGQYHRSISHHFHEATRNGQRLILTANTILKESRLKLREQRRVIRQNRYLALAAGRDQLINIARVEFSLGGNYFQSEW